VTFPGGANQTEAYDSAGNMTSVIGKDAQNHVITSFSYAYTQGTQDLNVRLSMTESDPLANLTTSYTYDELGNLTHVVLPSGTTIDYVIDGQNRSIGKKVNGTLVKGWLYGDQLRPIAEVDGIGNVVSRFIYGTRINVPDLMVQGNLQYRIVADHLGSVRLVINVNSGAVMQRLDYDEFGRVTGDTNPGFQPFGFAGGVYGGDTSLTRFGARDYDAQMGRWTGKDPILFEGEDINLYGYTFADPVNLVDPYGLRVYSNNFVGPIQPSDLTVSEVGNIVFNETRSLSGDIGNLYYARVCIARSIINGSNAHGVRRPQTAPASSPSPSILRNRTENAAFTSSQGAAQDAFSAFGTNAGDFLGGAEHFNFRQNSSTTPFQGHQMRLQFGPFDQSVNSPGLSKCNSCTYANVYQ